MDSRTIANDLAAYGLEVVEWKARTDNGKTVLRDDAPLIKVTDPVKFMAEFPNGETVIASALDGSSIRVQCQDVVRRALLKNLRTADAELTAAQVNRLMGVKAPTGPKVMYVPASCDEATFRAIASANPGTKVVRQDA